MDRLKERDRAERCFSLARSTTFPGERDSAVARGMAICTKAGLDPDQFDIPGRAKSARPQRPPQQDGFDFHTAAGGPYNPYTGGARRYDRYAGTFEFEFDADTMAELEKVWAEVAAQATRSKHDWQRERDANRARARAQEQQQARWPTAREASDFLFMRGVQVYDLRDHDKPDLKERWFVPSEGGDALDDWGLRDLADKVAGL